MPLVLVGSVRGRPGVTTVALGLTAVVTSEVRAVLVEGDPSGGDLMMRHGLAARPGLVDLAAGARTARQAGTAAEYWDEATQSMTFRGKAVRVVAAPPGGTQSRAALPELTEGGRRVLETPDRLVVVDGGRLDVDSPCLALLETADVAVVLVRGRADEVAHLCERLPDLAEAAQGQLLVVVVGGGIYPPAEVSDALAAVAVGELALDWRAVRVVRASLPVDRRAAAILGGQLLPGRRWLRLPLMVGVSRLLEEISPSLALPVPIREANR